MASEQPNNIAGDFLGDGFIHDLNQGLPSARDGTQNEREPPMMGPNDVVIALMGVTGAGKSTFINHFCEGARIGDGLMSCTSEVEAHFSRSLTRNAGHRVWLVDTPGFDDSGRTDTEVLRDIAAFLSETYREKILLSGIIYLHRISDNRIGGSGFRQIQMFRKLCGEQSMGNIALATTMWSTVNINDGTRREAELMTEDGFWKRLLEQGASIFRQDRGDESAYEIVQSFIAKKKRVFDIQTEMVDSNKRLDETAAGKEISAELTKQRERYEKELRSIKTEMEQALVEKDNALTEELQNVKEEVERKLEDERRAAKRLQASRDDLYKQLEEQRQKDREMWENLLEQERDQRKKERKDLKKQVSEMQSQISTLQDKRSRPSTDEWDRWARRTFHRECCRCQRIEKFGLRPGKWYDLEYCGCGHECDDCCWIKMSVSQYYKFYYGRKGRTAYAS